jgi:alpha-maltose-1-phosphate synthase
MRVAFVLSLPYPAAPGGAERWFVEVARALDKHVDVTAHYMVRVGDRSSSLAIEESSTGIPTQLHRCVAPPGRHGYRLALAPGLIRAMSSAEVVHVHQFGSMSAQLLGAMGRLGGASTFVTDHGSSGVELGRKLGLVRLFDGFLAVSEFAASFSASSRTRVVLGGVDPELFQPGERSAEPFALYVGRLLPHKGVDWLIRSLPSGARLVVAGRPDPEDRRGYLELLRSLARGKDVQFLLEPTDAEIAALYRSAWAAVLPSLDRDVYGRHISGPELLGLTALEAMASGTPVIASKVASLPEVVRHGENGMLVEPGDETALKSSLARLLADRETVESIGSAARADAVARFSWDRVADRCLRAYQALGHGRRLESNLGRSPRTAGARSFSMRASLGRLRIMAIGIWMNLSRGWRATTARSFARWFVDTFMYRVLAVAPIGVDRLRTIHFRDGGVITYRLNRGDVRTIAETWMNRAYELPFIVERPRVILDLGANIGATSIWLARRYGCERVIAVEPVPANAALARRNLAANGVPGEVHEAVVGPGEGIAHFADSPESTLGRLADQGREVRVVTVPALIDAEQIDLMKMDIEGAEAALLAGRPPWLGQVRLIVAEIHPQFADADRVVRTLEEAGFDCHLLADDHVGPKGAEFMAAFVRPSDGLSTSEVPGAVAS